MTLKFVLKHASRRKLLHNQNSEFIVYVMTISLSNSQPVITLRPSYFTAVDYKIIDVFIDFLIKQNGLFN